MTPCRNGNSEENRAARDSSHIQRLELVQTPAEQRTSPYRRFPNLREPMAAPKPARGTPARCLAFPSRISSRVTTKALLTVRPAGGTHVCLDVYSQNVFCYLFRNTRNCNLPTQNPNHYTSEPPSVLLCLHRYLGFGPVRPCISGTALVQLYYTCTESDHSRRSGPLDGVHGAKEREQSRTTREEHNRNTVTRDRAHVIESIEWVDRLSRYLLVGQGRIMCMWFPVFI